MDTKIYDLFKNIMITLSSPVWFSPVNVLYYFAKLEKKLTVDQKLTKEFKKAKEANAVATMLIGMIKTKGKEYWMQLVDDREGSPDIRSGNFYLQYGKFRNFHIQDVEVVLYEEHSGDNLVDFLKRIKLSSAKSYDKKTTILCNIEKNIFLPKFHIINQKLKNLRACSSVIIIGRISPTQPIYKMGQIYPVVDLIENFDLKKECLNKKYHGVLQLKRGISKELDFVYNPTEKHYPFATLKFD